MKKVFFCLALSLSLFPGLASVADSTSTSTTPAPSTDDKNVISAVDPTNHTIEVSRKSHNTKTDYILATDVIVQIPGNSNATVSDLKVGMVVQSVRLDSGIDDPATIEEIDIQP